MGNHKQENVQEYLQAFIDEMSELFSVAIFCLASPLFCEAYCDYAKQLLILFVSQFGQFYGEDQYVYNVHSLVHLADDVAKFGELNNFSAFAFESFLGKLKRLVRKPNYPLQQVIRRLSESQNSLHQSNTPKIPPCGFVKKNDIGVVPVQENIVHTCSLSNLFYQIVIFLLIGTTIAFCLVEELVRLEIFSQMTITTQISTWL